MKLSRIGQRSKYRRCSTCGKEFKMSEPVWTTGGKGSAVSNYYCLHCKPKEY